VSDPAKPFNKQILVAVDTSDNSRRAVEYVAQMLGGHPGFEITLLHVINPPDEDYFSSAEEQVRWLRNYQEKIDKLLSGYRQTLIDSGFKPKAVLIHTTLRYCPSMAECILSERNDKAYGTIVVGRQGISRSEAFLFGSVSNKIVNHASNCTVWVVE
jgi:nucleotide-binding universal stress UspA family protein